MEPDRGLRGEDLVSIAMTFMDYTFKSPWRQEITTAKIQITEQAYKWQWRLLPCINAFQTASDLKQIQQAATVRAASSSCSTSSRDGGHICVDSVTASDPRADTVWAVTQKQQPRPIFKKRQQVSFYPTFLSAFNVSELPEEELLQFPVAGGD